MTEQEKQILIGEMFTMSIEDRGYKKWKKYI